MTKTDSKEEYKTEDITIVVHRKPSCTIELDVKVSNGLVEKAQKMAVKDVSKQISIPGFRKGKAPQEIILKRYSGSVEEKLHKHVADLAFKKAVQEINIPPLSNGPKIVYDVKKVDLKEGGELTFKYEAEPTVPVVDPKTYQPKQITKQVIGEKEINEAIRQTQFFYAKWTEITDRPVQEKDFILLDLETVDEPKEKVFTETRFEVADEYMAKWMKDLVVGMKPNESKEGVSEPDATATEKDRKEFQPKKVQLTIKKIETPNLPEMNDEFAKKLGTKDIETFKISIEEMLNKKASEKYNNELREDVNRFLLKQYPFDLPSSLLKNEKEFRLKQMLNSTRAQEEYKKAPQEEKAKLDASITKQSEDAVKLFYLSRKIVNDAKVEVNYEDVMREAIQSMQSYGSSQVDPKQIPQEVYALAFSKVMLKKAQDHILKQTAS